MDPRPHLSLLAAALLAVARSAGADGPAADCRALADDRARLACYDATAGRSATPEVIPPPGNAAAPATAPPGATAPATKPTAEDLFGRDGVQSEAMARAAAGIGQTDAIEASVSRLSRNAYGKLEIELDNGQAWTQLDATRLALAPGSAVRIRRAALGSYLLAPQAGGQSIRVRRQR